MFEKWGHAMCYLLSCKWFSLHIVCVCMYNRLFNKTKFLLNNSYLKSHVKFLVKCEIEFTFLSHRYHRTVKMYSHSVKHVMNIRKTFS